MRVLYVVVARGGDWDAVEIAGVVFTTAAAAAAAPTVSALFSWLLSALALLRVSVL